MWSRKLRRKNDDLEMKPRESVFAHRGEEMHLYFVVQRLDWLIVFPEFLDNNRVA